MNIKLDFIVLSFVSSRQLFSQLFSLGEMQPILDIIMSKFKVGVDMDWINRTQCNSEEILLQRGRGGAGEHCRFPNSIFVKMIGQKIYP